MKVVYSRGYGHPRHSLAYVFRYPVVDLYKVLRGIGHVSVPPQGWLRRMLARPTKEKRFQWLRWMAQRWIYSYAARLDVTIPKKN
jgi:hypothetical protein